MGRALVLVLILSVLLRGAVAFYLGDAVPAPPGAPDDTSYSYLAERLAGGHGFSFDQPWYPFGKPAGYPTAHWSFLYTAFVAGIYRIFGAHPLAVRLVTAVLGGVMMPLLTWRLARRVLPNDDRLALIAAACGAFYGYFVLYAARLVTETLYIAAVMWSMERALAVVERPSLRRAASLGLALGLAALLRQSILPWLPVLAVWLLLAGRRSGRLGLVGRALVVAMAIVVGLILPFTIRNYSLYHDFLLLNSNAGYAFYSAQHPMHGTRFQPFEAAPMPQELSQLDEPELDRELMQRGIGFVLADPARYVRLSWSRVAVYFEIWPTPGSPLLYNVGQVASAGVALPLIAIGLVLAVRRYGPLRSRRMWVDLATAPLALILLFAVFYSLLHILTWAMARYRLPIDAVLLPFAALALNDLIVWLYRRLAREGSRLPISGKAAGTARGSGV